MSRVTYTIAQNSDCTAALLAKEVQGCQIKPREALLNSGGSLVKPRHVDPEVTLAEAPGAGGSCLGDEPGSLGRGALFLQGLIEGRLGVDDIDLRPIRGIRCTKRPHEGLLRSTGSFWGRQSLKAAPGNCLPGAVGLLAALRVFSGAVGELS